MPLLRRRRDSSFAPCCRYWSFCSRPFRPVCGFLSTFLCVLIGARPDWASSVPASAAAMLCRAVLCGLLSAGRCGPGLYCTVLGTVRGIRHSTDDVVCCFDDVISAVSAGTRAPRPPRPVQVGRDGVAVVEADAVEFGEGVVVARHDAVGVDDSRSSVRTRTSASRPAALEADRHRLPHAQVPAPAEGVSMSRSRSRRV